MQRAYPDWVLVYVNGDLQFGSAAPTDGARGYWTTNAGGGMQVFGFDHVSISAFPGA